jgi:AcrR family transcriptional regulator
LATHDTHDVREHILNTAADLFMLQGYKGISMREIAEASGFSKAGLYYHFRDKEHLFIEILRRNLESFSQKFHRVNAKGKTASEKLELLVLEFLETSERDRAIAHLAEREMVHVSEAEKNKFTAVYQSCFLGPIMAIISEGHRSGELNCPNEIFAVRIFLGMCWPFLMSQGAKHFGPMSTSDAHALVHAFLHGFAKN